MKDSSEHIGLKIGEVKTHLQKEEYIKAYQSLLELEEEFYERNERIEDVDVSDMFDRSDIERAKAVLHEPRGIDIPPGTNKINKARLVVGYINE